MRKIEQILKKYPREKRVYKGFGSHDIADILGVGIMYKDRNYTVNMNYVTEYYACSLILRGEGFFEQDGIKTHLSPGSIFQRKPYKLHSTYATSDDWVEIFFSIGNEFYELFCQVGIIPNENVFKVEMSDELLTEWIKLLDFFDNLNENETKRAIARIVSLITEIYYLKKPKSEISPHIKNAVEFIEKNASENISPQSVAKSINLSYDWFRKIFKTQVGVSPHQYIIQKRVEQAKKMLLSTDKTIDEIAFTLGYYDASFFVKQFKSVEKQTPANFRKRFS